MNTRSKMRRSNQKAIEYLLERGYEAVYLQQHLRWDTITYFKDGTKLKSKDMLGLFDGIALKDGKIWFLQISTNRFHPKQPYVDFSNRYKANIILINVKDRKGISARILISI